MPNHEQSTFDQIIALANAGMTRKAIAAQVGGLSCSAVCGVLWRAGIVAPIKVTKPKPAPAKKSGTGTCTKSTVKSATAQLEVQNSPGSRTESSGVWWDHLTSHHCRWPLANGMWCGSPKDTGSYCPHHTALAYRKAA